MAILEPVLAGLKKNNKSNKKTIKKEIKLNMRCTKVPSKTAIGGTKKKRKCEEKKQNEKGAPMLVSGLRTSPSSLHV